MSSFTGETKTASSPTPPKPPPSSIAKVSSTRPKTSKLKFTSAPAIPVSQMNPIHPSSTSSNQSLRSASVHLEWVRLADQSNEFSLTNNCFPWNYPHPKDSQHIVTVTSITSSMILLQPELIPNEYKKIRGITRRSFTGGFKNLWLQIYSYLQPSYFTRIRLKCLCRLLNDVEKMITFNPKCSPLQPIPLYTSFPHPKYASLEELTTRLNELSASLNALSAWSADLSTVSPPVLPSVLLLANGVYDNVWITLDMPISICGESRQGVQRIGGLLIQELISNVIYDDLEAKVTTLYPTYNAMHLKEELLKGIYAYGFEKPSDIQQLGIVTLLQGRDTIFQAQSGTNRVATYSIAILQTVDIDTTGCQALILVPKRESAQSISKVIVALCEYLNVKVHAVFSGRGIREDIRISNEGVHIVVGTPRRCWDMINRGALRLDDLKIICFDSADEMLARGLRDQINDVLKFVPKKVQVCLLTNTLPIEVRELSQRCMHEPIGITNLTISNATLEGVTQFYIDVEREEWKLDTLCDLYETLTITQAVIYCNNRRKVDWLTEKMSSRDYDVTAIHGDMDQEERDFNMRARASRVIITTDLFAQNFTHHEVTSMGLNYSLVINYDMPTRAKYLPRVGRSGRVGGKRFAINFLTASASDLRCLRDIEQFYNTPIEEMPMDVADLL